MFEYEYYCKLDWQNKISYVSKLLDFELTDVNYILDTSSINTDQQISDQYEKIDFDYHNKSKINNNINIHKLYQLNIVFNYLVTVSGYDHYSMRSIWEGENRYSDLLNKPPWHEYGLKRYLRNYREHGLEKCIEWIRSF